MELNRIILDNYNKKTSSEKDLGLLYEMEKAFNTGPIIGEARDLLLHLIRNLQTRDLFLSCMGFDDAAKEEIFIKVNQQMEENDRELIRERELNE